MDDLKVEVWGVLYLTRKQVLIFELFFFIFFSGLTVFLFTYAFKFHAGSISYDFHAKYAKYFSLATTVLIIMEAQFFWLKITKAQLDLIEKQKKDIFEKNEEILVQSDQLIERNEEIEIQKKELVEQSIELEEHWNIALKSKTVILDSINYAKKIQKAVLPSKEYVNEVLDEYFLLFKPRDIVSGDFYWIKKIEDSIIIAIADCTGHGVPGAFMSMLGTSFLNEIVRSKNIENTDEILNLLRYKVKESLGQEGRKNETKDAIFTNFILYNTRNIPQSRCW